MKYPLAYRAARATVAARRALEQGFTTLRDVETEGAGYGDVGLKMAINEGRIPGPRLFVVTREGSMFAPRYPRAVCNANITTTQRLVDVMLGALLEALPLRLGAASSGSTISR